MRKVFEHADFAIVGFYQSILEEAGIPTCLKNVDSSAAMGLAPFSEVYPELWVANEVDYERALEVLEPYYQQAAEEAHLPAWRCPSCGAEVEGTFGECWKCGALRPKGTDEEGNELIVK